MPRPEPGIRKGSDKVIGHLSGVVRRAGPDFVVLDVGGVGYIVTVASQTRQQLPARCAVDVEPVVIRRDAGATPKLDFELLGQRIHPAASRVRMLAETTPASIVAFDLLLLGDLVLLETPYPRRRERLEELLAKATPPVYLTPTTTDVF